MPQRRISSKECGDTGMAMVLICLLAALSTGARGWIMAATALLLLNMVWPSAYRPVAQLWLGLSRLLGSVMSRVILGLVFFGLLTPLALLRRLRGHDPLRLKQWKTGSGSVFTSRGHTVAAEELEQPF